MKALMATFAAAALLAGCTTVGKIASTKDISLRTVYTVRAGYDAAFLAPAANYRRLGLCPKIDGVEQKPTLAAPCAQRAVVVKLQAADRVAEAALDNLETYVRAHPGEIGASGLYDAAQKAIATAEAALAETKE